MSKLIAKLICRSFGHKWGKAFNAGLDAWVKQCRRCPATAPVKRRAPRKTEVQ